MPDYQSLFYQSQAKISELISQLEILTADLVTCMQNCEESVIESDDVELDAENDET
ncbi:MAG: hypothetical protein K2G25_07310 [Oscillospiraceae bacterium]|nr:hypothetical protein [Oscillospiraceae bacterium]